MSTIRRFIDIGANLTDPMYNGVYHGSKKHDNDLKAVLERAWENGLKRIIITGGSLQDCKDALVLAGSDEKLFCTVGCHPTRCGEFENSGDPTKYMKDLVQLAKENKAKVVAVGECGLDYDRLNFCPRETQKRFFEQQLDMCDALNLPLFLHCRNAAPDLLEILERNKHRLYGGVVHSFDGSKEDAAAIVDMGYYIGINGCSLKTEQNLQVMASIPSESLMIETDCPWCEVRPTHAGFKYIKSVFGSVKKEKWIPGHTIKGRNEPSHIKQILEIMAAIRKEDPDTLCNVMYENTEKLFFAKKTL